MPREPGGQLLKASRATPTGVSGQSYGGGVCAGQWLCSEVSTLPLVENCLTCVLPGKGAVFL